MNQTRNDECSFKKLVGAEANYLLTIILFNRVGNKSNDRNLKKRKGYSILSEMLENFLLNANAEFKQ